MTEILGVGCGLDHRLAIGKAELNTSLPMGVPFFNDNPDLAVQRVWAGGSHSMVLTDAGLFAFGYNEQGQLGVGCFGTNVKPAVVPQFKPSEIVDISLGGYHSMIHTTDGCVYTCGSNADGALGDGSEDNAKHPKKVTDLSDVKKISAGAHHSLAWTSQGVFSWGLGDNGQLGYTGDSWDEMLAKQNRIKAFVADNAKMATLKGCMVGEVETALPLLESGAYNPAMHPHRRASDTRNFFAPFCQRMPQRIPNIDPDTVTDISAGYSTSVVMTTEGALIFGARPGAVRETTEDSTPTLTTPPAGMRFVQLLGIKDLRVALCQPADDTEGLLSFWTQTENDSSFSCTKGELPLSTVMSGTERTVALTAGKTVMTYGDNYYGQLGQEVPGEEDEATSLCPLGFCKLGDVTSVKSVSCAWRHALIVVEKGEAKEEEGSREP